MQGRRRVGIWDVLSWVQHVMGVPGSEEQDCVPAVQILNTGETEPFNTLPAALRDVVIDSLLRIRFQGHQLFPAGGIQYDTTQKTVASNRSQIAILHEPALASLRPGATWNRSRESSGDVGMLYGII